MSIGNELNKKNIHEFGKRIYNQTPDTIEELLREYYHEDTIWNGPYPFKKVEGVKELCERFWKPFLKSFPDVQKNDYILFGGSFKDNEWVHSSGNFLATFEEDFLDIPCTKRPVWIRYGEYHKMKNGKVAETIVVIDLLDLMRQAGIRFYPSTSQEIVIPGPYTLDGIQLGEHSEEESKQTLQLIEDMIFKGLHSYKEGDHASMNNEKYWHKDFMYYAPCGIGPTRGIKGFEKYHQKPFLISFPDRKGGMHEARFAEGKYCCSTGPVKMTHTGSEWLGLPSTNKPISLRAMDIWRREDDKLVENWLFLDIIDLLYQIDIDIFERLRNKKYIL